MKKEKFIIEVEYGSDFQKEVWHKFLESFINVVMLQMEGKHKKNKLTYKIK